MENTGPKRGWRGFFAFVALAYAFSWAFWIPEALQENGVLRSDALARFLAGPFNQAAYGPSVAAFLLVTLRGGWAALGRFIRQGLTRRFFPVWLLPILFLMPLIAWLSLRIGAPEAAGLAIAPGAIPAAAAMILLTAGPLQEEFGWRGYALPAAQGRAPGLVAAIAVGVVWALWHLPLNFASGEEGPQYSAAVAMILGGIVTLTLVSILACWLYNVTGGSVLATILFHASMNLSTFFLFPVFDHPGAVPVYTGLILLAALGAVLLGGWRRLGRATAGDR